MAREEEDREDLLAEAVALVERIELKLADGGTPIVAGFRRDGSASFFFGADPVYQFNSRRELRRAYRNGQLIKANRGHLASLTRHRTEREVQLIRQDLSDAETAELLTDAIQRLANLGRALDSNAYTIVGQVPDNTDIVGRVRSWLAQLSPQLTIATSPRVK